MGVKHRVGIPYNPLKRSTNWRWILTFRMSMVDDLLNENRLATALKKDMNRAFNHVNEASPNEYQYYNVITAIQEGRKPDIYDKKNPPSSITTSPMNDSSRTEPIAIDNRFSKYVPHSRLKLKVNKDTFTQVPRDEYALFKFPRPKDTYGEVGKSNWQVLCSATYMTQMLDNHIVSYRNMILASNKEKKQPKSSPPKPLQFQRIPMLFEIDGKPVEPMQFIPWATIADIVGMTWANQDHPMCCGDDRVLNSVHFTCHYKSDC